MQPSSSSFVSSSLFHNCNVAANDVERKWRCSMTIGTFILTVLIQSIYFDVFATRTVMFSPMKWTGKYKAKMKDDDDGSSLPPEGSLLPEAGADVPPTTSYPSHVDVDNVDNADVDEDETHKYWWKLTTQSADTLVEDIDLEAIIDSKNNITTCGWWKCYYPSKSQRSKYGYVIGQDRRKITTKSYDFNMENHKNAYNLALKLQKQFDIRHFMVSPPLFMDCTKELADVLNIGFMSTNPTIPYKKPPKKNKTTIIPNYRLFRETTTTATTRTTADNDNDNEHDDDPQQRENRLIIQVVKQAPKPNLLINLKGIRSMSNPISVFKFAGAQSFFQNLQFINIPGTQKFSSLDDNNNYTTTNVSSSFKSNNSSDENNDNNNNNKYYQSSFRKNLIHDWNITKLTWYEYPELLLDYQFLLDFKGRIWQIDIDRAFGNFTEERQRGINNNNATYYVLSQLKKIEESIINPLLL